VVSTAILAFLFAVEHFNIFERRPVDPEADPASRPIFDHTSEVWLGPPRVAGLTKYSLAFIIAAAVGFMLLPGHKLESRGIPDVTAQDARGGDTLFIDGNRDGYGVSFKHRFHIDKNGGDTSCVLCHHMNLPADRQSTCAGCHRSMYKTSDAFRHDWHSSPKGANLACVKCHTPGVERTAASAKKCDACHLDLIPAGTKIAIKSYMAPSYADAMHGLCVNCHKQKLAEYPDKPNLARCETCHTVTRPEYLKAEAAKELAPSHYNKVVLPPSTPPPGEQ
jgi:hypothetical protein